MPRPDINVMRAVMNGKLSLEAIRQLEQTNRHTLRQRRVSGAVAYIFLHRATYLRADNSLVRPYGPLMYELVGVDTVPDSTAGRDQLIEVSRGLNLHTRGIIQGKYNGRSVVRLRLPPDALKEDPDVVAARELYVRLCEQYTPGVLCELSRFLAQSHDGPPG